MAKILIAEDDDSMRQFLVMALERAGHDVTACADGLDAFKMIEAHDDFNLLLADIVMPGMDGIELSHKAATLRPGLKTMFITGFAAVTMDRVEASAEGRAVPPVLSKPFHLKELVDRIEALLAV